jgi:glucose/arabinose dehydrogenase
MRILMILLLAGALFPATATAASPEFEVEMLVDGGLKNPWGLAFLPNGDLLITERQGNLRVFRDGALVAEPIAGLPPIREVRQGGLLGIALHPRFADNRLIYLAYAGAEGGAHSTEVLRGRFDGARLEQVETIFRARPKVRGGRHFGGRLLFDDAGYLFITLGDRGRDDDAQDLNLHSGSLIRLHDDGTIPADNPFNDNPAAAPGIYTLGNRNMQGIVVHPQTREVWTHEHGPQGGDEVNIMRAGVNYGWPVITYGRNYGTGTQIGEGTHKDGMAQPIYKWVPSIAPSGMTFYTGERFGQWRGDLFVGSLKFGLLVRLDVEGEAIVGEQRMLHNVGRVRDVIEGPDGFLYLVTDSPNGQLLRLVPPGRAG